MSFKLMQKNDVMDIATNEVAGGMPPRGNKVKGIVFGAVGLALIAGMILFLPKERVNTEPVYKESPVIRGDITTGVSETGSISIGYQTVKYDISSSKMEDLGLTVKVEEVFIKAGQRVNEGDPLIRISTDDLMEQLNNAKLSLREAQANYTKQEIEQNIKKIEAKYTYENNLMLVDSAQSSYDLTIAELNNQISEHEASAAKLTRQIRFLKSYLSDNNQEYFIDNLEENPTDINFRGWDDSSYELPSEATVKNRLKEYERSYDSLLVKLEKARLELEKTTNTSQATKESNLYKGQNASELYQIELAQIENNLASSKLKIESAQKQVDQFTKYLADDGIITSPITGTIMSASYNIGDDITSNQAIAVISNPQKASMSVSIVQEDVVSLELDQTAIISLDAFPDTTFEASLDSMSVSPLRTGGSTVSYNVTAVFKEPSDKFFEGMTGNITFITKQLEDVLIVANRAVKNTNGVQTVKVKLADGTIEEREIVTGFSDGRNVEVISGLAEGDIALIESQVAVK